jgi:transcriptional regulator with XRE-family HTH domain
MPRRPATHVDSAAAVGERLLSARKSAGLSQRDLAFPGCTAAYISRIETGRRVPSLQILRVLAQRLDTTADYLATGDDAPGDPLFDAELAARTGDLAEARQLYEAARAAGGAEVAARVDAALGRLAYDEGANEDAVAYLERAIAAAALPAPERDGACDLLGRALALLARFEEALAVFEGALTQARAEGDQAAAIRFSVLLANTLIDRGNASGAEEVLAGVLEPARASRDPVIVSQLYWSQARLHASQGRSDLATRYARMAHATLEATEHSLYAARALVLLAHLENDRGRPEAALDLVEDGQTPIAASGNRCEEGMLLLEKARALAALGRHEEAAGIALGAIPRFEHAHPTSAGRGYAIAAQILGELGDQPRALELYELAAETIPVSDRHLVEVYRAMAAIHEGEGRTDDAMQCLKLALDARGAPAPSAMTEDSAQLT